MKGRPKKPEVQEAIKRCKELGITYSGYLGRIKNGWTKEEALNTPRVGAVYRTKDGTPIFTYLKSIGKSYNKFVVKLHQGYTVEEAFEIATRPKRNKRHYRDGMSLREYCEKHGLNYVTEYHKIWRGK